jgi:hypothetical protein
VGGNEKDRQSREMRLDEYAELVPNELYSEPSVVLDGFTHPIELLHFSIKGMPL